MTVINGAAAACTIVFVADVGRLRVFWNSKVIDAGALFSSFYFSQQRLANDYQHLTDSNKHHPTEVNVGLRWNTVAKRYRHLHFSLHKLVQPSFFSFSHAPSN